MPMIVNLWTTADRGRKLERALELGRRHHHLDGQITGHFDRRYEVQADQLSSRRPTGCRKPVDNSPGQRVHQCRQCYRLGV